MKTTLHLWQPGIAAFVIIGLSACGGGGSHSAPLPSTPGSSGSGTSPSSTLVSTLLPNSFLASTQKLGPATNTSGMVMHVVVNMKDARGLSDYARGANDPRDGRYRQWLTASDIANRFGAQPGDYAAVAQYFASYGLRVGSWPQRLALTVAGSQANFEKALGTTMATYLTSDGRTLIGPSGPIHFSKPLPVSQIADAVADPHRFHRQYVRGAGGEGNAQTNGATPQQIQTVFDFTGAFNAGFTGKGINVGIVGTGPILQDDFKTYKQLFNYGGSATLTQVNATSAAAAAAGGSPTATPPPTTKPCTGSLPACNPEDFEAQIDTEQASLAKDANVLFYLAYVPVECNTPNAATCSPDPTTGLGFPYIGLVEADDEIQQAIADNNGGGNGPDILSLSYGGGEIGFGTYNATPTGAWDPTALGPSEFAALASEGVAVFVSSGDAGAEGCSRPPIQNYVDSLCVSYPAADPNVTSVGGVTVPMNNAGQLSGPITAWGAQTATVTGGASGGGVSRFIPLPTWQTGKGVVGSTRNQPDVSLLADGRCHGRQLGLRLASAAFRRHERLGSGDGGDVGPRVAGVCAEPVMCQGNWLASAPFGQRGAVFLRNLQQYDESKSLQLYVLRRAVWEQWCSRMFTVNRHDNTVPDPTPDCRPWVQRGNRL